MKKKLSKVN